jgi:hypothetical protein
MLENVALFFACLAFGYTAGWAVDKWVTRHRKKRIKVTHNPSIDLGVRLGGTEESKHNAVPKFRLGMVEAINGNIIEISTATLITGHSHYDWKTELYVVPEGQKLSEAIATLMLMKGLEQ